MPRDRSTAASSAPFFVVGSPRSGTTMLRRLLCAHPELYIPGETGFLPFLRFPPDRPLDGNGTRRFLRRLATLNRHWAHGTHELGGSTAPRLPAEILEKLYRKRAEAHGASRWGDKTPGYVRYLPRLDALFPGCRVVHLIRDGRDVALSARTRWGSRHWYMDLRYLLRQWALNVSTGRRGGATLGPERYLEVRYEGLVKTPRDSLAEILAFLGEPMHEAVADAIDHGTEIAGSRFDAGVQRPVSRASVGRWRQGLTGPEQRLADRLVGPLLQDLAYEASGRGATSLPERVAGLGSAARYAFSSTLRRALYAIGVLALNRGQRSRPWPLPARAGDLPPGNAGRS